MQVMKEHQTEDSCWLIIHGKVYDVTKFLAEHPGGKEILLQQTNQDASAAYDLVQHTPGAQQYMKKYLIGRLAQGNYQDLQEFQRVYVKVMLSALLIFVMAYLVKRAVRSY